MLILHDHEALDAKRVQNPDSKFLQDVVMWTKGTSIRVVEGARTETAALACLNQQGGCV